MSGESRRSFGLLADEPPSSTDRRLALLVIGTSLLCLAVMAPFARVPLPRVAAFVPAYESALAINDLITAVILFGQFARLHRLSVLLAAAAYLYDACLVVIHILSFPGVFSETGLLGASIQTTAWLYVFWHAGFPVFVLGYALVAKSRRDLLPAGLRTGTAIALAVAGVAAAATILTLASTVGVDRLPTIIEGGNYARMVEIGVSPGLLVLTAVAMAALWPRRHASMLDMWLFAVLWVWLCDVSLSAVIGSSRFDLGWYGGRLFGLVAASLVLGSLLVESNRLYTLLAEALAAAEAQNAELVRSRSELARAQRLEAVGQLTGGIAHDFNNLLTAIAGGLDLIARKPDDRERVVRLAGVAQKAADRGARLVSQLMTFARQQNLKPEVLHPNSVLAEFESFAGRAAGASVAVVFALESDIHPVCVDSAEFQAAMLNLVTNARDAMPDGGMIRIESRNVRLATGDVQGQLDVAPGDYVMVAVSDNGTGMSAETQAKAFEPFFTTKSVGAGTGLGLSQVFGFAKAADGHVTIRSSLGHGTTFELYLPRSRQPLPTAQILLEADGAEPRAALHGEHVLIVEDDPQVMATTVESLRELGYAVLTSESADQALGLLRADRRIDIMFSDVVMPGHMNGFQLAAEAKRLRPNLRILLTSGYTGAALRERGMVPDLPLLSKPYGRAEMANMLHKVLANP